MRSTRAMREMIQDEAIWRAARYLVLSTLICAITAGLASSPVAATECPPKPADGSAADVGFGLHLVDGASMQDAPLVANLIEIQVTGIVARARVTQIFTNPANRQVEAVYVFPIPDDAAVDSLRLRVGEREVVGEVHEKKAAEEIYRKAESEGRVASLLSMQRPDVFTTWVTQIGPGETVEIEIGLQFLVDYQGGEFRLRFPMVVAPRYVMSADVMSAASKEASPGGFAFQLPRLLQPTVAAEGIHPAAFHVMLDTGFPLAELASPSHRIHQSSTEGGQRIVRLEDETTAAGRDFLLTWRPQSGTTPSTAVLVDEVDGERYALVMIIPPDAPDLGELRLPRETVFVVDTSGSMKGPKLEQARDALLLALDGFLPGDRINVVRFSDKPTALFEQARFATQSNLDEARRFVEGLMTDGGTEMVPALERALRDDSSSHDLRQVIFITDGQVTEELAFYEKLDRKLGRSRVFTVGIGAAPNAEFMRQVARLGRGTYTPIFAGADVRGPMESLLRAIDSPMLRDVQLSWNDPSVDPARDMFPGPIPDLYSGEPLVVAAKIGGATELHASGWLRDRLLELTVPLDHSADPTGAGIGREWARRRVESLMLSRRLNLWRDDPGGEELRRQVVDLGLRHQLVTPFTSLVSVDHVQTVQPEAASARVPAPQRVLMPANPVDPLGSDAVTEELIVISQAPLVDSRAVSYCSAVEPLETAFRSAGPWVTLASRPGVRVDRLGLDRLDSGAPAPALRVVGRGGSTAADLSIDGAPAVRFPTLGWTPAFHSFRSLEEMSANHHIQLEHDGVLVDLRTGRGGHRWRSGLQSHALAASGHADGRDRVRRDEGANGEVGGPLVDDRLWAWLGSGLRDGERVATDGDVSRHRTWTGLAKLIGSIGLDRGTWTASWNGGDRKDRGLGAGPKRAESAQLDLDSTGSSWSLDGVWMASSAFFASVGYSEADSRGSLATSSAGSEEVPQWDELGVVHGDMEAKVERQTQRRLEASADYFTDFASSSHEIRVGLRSTDGDGRVEQHGRMSDDPALTGYLPVSSAVLGLAGDDRGFRLYDPQGSARLDSRHLAAWLQDEVGWGKWSGRLGLRWDEQRLALLDREPGGYVRWSHLAPRVSVARAFGWESATLLQVSWARFHESLRPDVLTRTVPGLAGRALFADDRLLDGAGAVWPHRTDPDLEASPTDELVVSLQQQLGWSTVVSLGLVHRWQRDVTEKRDLVLDGGVLRTALARDYELDHTATGSLPDGTAYSAPVYRLRDPLGATGALLLTNGSRDVEYEGVTFSFHKRHERSWSMNGHFHYGEARWRVGDAYRSRRDPTDLLGAGDRDGDLVVTAPDDLEFGFGPWLGSRWSAEVDATVDLFDDTPWAFRLSGQVHAREGDPLPYYDWNLGERSAGQARRIQLTESVDQLRMDDVITVHLGIAKELPDFGPLGTLLRLEVLNLTDEDTAIDRRLSVSGPGAALVDETVASRTVRFGVRLSLD